MYLFSSATIRDGEGPFGNFKLIGPTYMLSGFSFAEPHCVHYPLDFDGTIIMECPHEHVIQGGDDLHIGITDKTSANLLNDREAGIVNTAKIGEAGKVLEIHDFHVCQIDRDQPAYKENTDQFICDR